MSSTRTKIAAAGIALVTAFGAVVPSAQAGGYRHHHRGNDGGAAAAAIIFGLAAGAIAAGAMAQQQQPRYYYGEPRRRCWTEREPLYNRLGENVGSRAIRFCR